MKRLARVVFWGYAVALFVATHWPNLRIESDFVHRPDVFIHVGAFGLWAMLLIATGYFAPGANDPLAESRGVREWAGIVLRPRAVLPAGLVAMMYAGADELLQGVPGLGRTVAWDDYAANCGGIMIAAVLALIIQYQVGRMGARR